MQNCMYTAQGHLVCMESFIDVTNTNVMSESMNAFNMANAANAANVANAANAMNVMNSANPLPAMNSANVTNPLPAINANVANTMPAINANVTNVANVNAVKTNPLGVMSESMQSIQSQSINCSTFKYASGCDNQAGCKWNSTDSVCRPDCLHISADACGNYPACVIKTTQTCAFNA